MNLGEILKTTLSDMNIISAITSTVFIILLGYFCRKKEIFSDKVAKILSNVVLTVALPALAFNAFMQDIKPEQLQESINVLIWGIAIYILLIIVTKVIFIKYQGDRQDTLRVLSIFGSTTFFGIPIATAVYGPQFGATIALLASVFNIGYRVFLYSYGYIKMSGLKMELKNIKTMFLNPIVIMTFLGLIIWIFQGYMPKVDVSVAVPSAVEKAKVINTDVIKQFAFLRIDQTAPWLYKPLTYLAPLASPLAWLAIGATLGEVSFKKAMTDKTSWIYTIIKIAAIPAINIVILAILTKTGILPISFAALATITIMLATPPATVAAAYAISFDKEALLASNASLLATLAAVVMMPIWIVILEVINKMGIF